MPQVIRNKPTDAIAAWPIIEGEGITIMGVQCRSYMMNGCRILVSNEPQGWHLSISRRDRDPTWREIATARYRLLPDVPEMGMFLPPLDEYVNMHPFCFHLHEQRRSSLILP